MSKLSEELETKFKEAGQGHVLEYYNALPEAERGPMKAQIEEIPVDKLAGYLEAAYADAKAVQENTAAKITPFSKTAHRSTEPEIAQKAYEQGLDAIGKGSVAALVLAGGQGTRLGFSGPKGMYDIGLPSGRTLFQLNAERILKLRKLAAEKLDEETMAPLPFYIMTSPINHDETVQYFKDQSFFGLPEEDVFFFQQGVLPCLSMDGGKILMETKSKIAMAPDGNGGIYPALVKSGALKDMEDRKIQHIHVFSIDNALSRPADPIFIGQCILEKADCGNKVVWKADAHEKVGVIAEKDGKPCVVEYSEITKEMAEKVDDNGRLVFGAGNICNHYYHMDFLQAKIIPSLGNMFHIAKKKIPVWDKETQSTVKPSTNNGIKLESFIFDVFPLSERMTVMDFLREEDFAPVKNAPGAPTDSPDTALKLLSDLAKKWVTRAGGVFAKKAEGVCEVAPATSYGGEGLESLVQGKELTCPFTL